MARGPEVQTEHAHEPCAAALRALDIATEALARAEALEQRLAKLEGHAHYVQRAPDGHYHLTDLPNTWEAR